MIANLFSKITPNYRFNKLTDVDINIFSNKGLIIFDVDNTLVFSEDTKTKKEIIDWFKKINKSHKCICLSNSRTIKKRTPNYSRVFTQSSFSRRNQEPCCAGYCRVGSQNQKRFGVGHEDGHEAQ